VAPTQKKPGAQALDGRPPAAARRRAVDEGAVAKLRGEGKSLLPIGMTAVDGEFSRGDVIAVRDPSGRRSPRAGELRQRRSAHAVPQAFGEIEKLLGYMAEPEMIHRTNLVVTR
jgi:glutamate 5-kinase